jgi:hypothetical protein
LCRLFDILFCLSEAGSSSPLPQQRRKRWLAPARAQARKPEGLVRTLHLAGHRVTQGRAWDFWAWAKEHSKLGPVGASGQARAAASTFCSQAHLWRLDGRAHSRRQAARGARRRGEGAEARGAGRLQQAGSRRATGAVALTAGRALARLWLRPIARATFRDAFGQAQ